MQYLLKKFHIIHKIKNICFQCIGFERNRTGTITLEGKKKLILIIPVTASLPQSGSSGFIDTSGF